MAQAVNIPTLGTIGARIRFLRKKRGFKQEGLAAAIGITQPSLSLIENNKTEMPAGDTIAALCRVLRTTPEFIVAGAGDPDSIEWAIQEHELVHLWRDLPAAGRQMVLDAARSAQRALAPERKDK